MVSPRVRIVGTSPEAFYDQTINNFSRLPEGGVKPRLQRRLPARYRSTPNIGLGNRSGSDTRNAIASSGRQRNLFSSPDLIRESPWLPTSNLNTCNFTANGLRKRCRLLPSATTKIDRQKPAPHHSVHKPANPHAIDQTQHQKCGPDARSAIAHQRQWYARNRHPPHHHSNIHQYMK
jgi:hypothetical protein